jgi:osmotically-inducible protein OsmY
MSKGKGNELKHQVLAELEFDPEVDASKIGVTAEDGVITLTGHVPSYAEKWNAEKIAKRILGVKAVANEIEVALNIDDKRDDTDVAISAVNALSWNASVPNGRVRPIVANGWITLEGQVEWNYQKRAAEDAVRSLRGIRGVTNKIEVTPHVHAGDVKQKIEAALKRSAEVDSKNIIVETTESSVTLRGNVRSWAEHEDAVNAAWAAPGVTKVFDHISIRA